MRQPKKILKDAQECLSRGEGAIDTLPTIIKRIVRDGVWRDLSDKEGEPFKDFPSFVEYKLWWGLETRYDRLVEFCKDDQECHRLLLAEMPEAAERGGQEGNKNASKSENGGDNITSVSSRGTSSSHTLKRLKRDNPDLADAVIRGELSANAAAIEAGFRRPTMTICNDPDRAALSILNNKNFGYEFAQALKEAL